MTKHPWLYGIAVGVFFSVLWATLIFHGSTATRAGLGAVPGILFGATQGMAAANRRDRDRCRQANPVVWGAPSSCHGDPVA